jgi:hypothetical protein
MDPASAFDGTAAFGLPTGGRSVRSTFSPQTRVTLPVASVDIPFQVLTFKFRLRVTRKQHEALERILEDQRILYNGALAERIDCYRKTGKSISYYDQCKSLTAIRAECEGWAEYALALQRGTAL